MFQLYNEVVSLLVFCFLVDSAQWLSLCCQVVTIPFLIGLLVDCLLILPFVDNEVPVLDFSCTWFLGLQLLKFWTKLVSSNLFLLLSWSCSLKLLDQQNCFLTCKVVLANYACYYYLIGQYPGSLISDATTLVLLFWRFTWQGLHLSWPMSSIKGGIRS